jgi:aminopeptidase-like protein
MRTKYGAYKEYHTSLDDLDYVSEEGLFGAYDILSRCIEHIEDNRIYKTTTLCEPQMGRRNLRSTLGVQMDMPVNTILMSHILVYADGKRDVLSMANKFGVSLTDLLESVDILVKEKLLDRVI